MMKPQKLLALLLGLMTLAGTWAPLSADAKHYYSARAKRQPTYFQKHPYQKTGLIGAGVGAAAGGLLFGEKHNTGRNMVRGAAAGAAAGLGYEFLKKRGTFK